jgi:hypothetical protein
MDKIWDADVGRVCVCVCVGGGGNIKTKSGCAGVSLDSNDSMADFWQYHLP